MYPLRLLDSRNNPHLHHPMALLLLLAVLLAAAPQ